MGRQIILPSDYYNYGFTSPQSLFAEIREEMRSYFDTGIIDDTLFTLYTEKALKKLGRVSYKIDEILLQLEDYQACLPPDFAYARQVGVLSDICYTVPLPAATYQQTTCIISQVETEPGCTAPCLEPECVKSRQVFVKSTGEEIFRFKVSHLLRPGNHHASSLCSAGSPNRSSHSTDTFDIRDKKIITSFCSGSLHLVYYKEESDENQYQLIPDNHAITEYIKSFIKYKLYEQLYNMVTDETFNQIERKYQNYRQEYTEAFILADAEVKKQTIYQKINSINRSRRKLAGYYIP